MLHHIPLQLPLSILLMNLPTLCKSRTVPWSKKVAKHVTICKHQAHFLNPLTALTHGFFHWFQPFPTHRNPRAGRTGVPPHPSLHPEAWSVTLGWVENSKCSRCSLSVSYSSYSCNWKLDSFGVDLMWLMRAFSQYVFLGSLDTLNTGKLISRRASLGCFSSVEVWRVEHVTALPAYRATQSASRGWETIKFSEIGYMHICSHRDRICNVSFGCFSNESFTSVSFEVGCCLVAEMIVCWGVLLLVDFFWRLSRV